MLSYLVRCWHDAQGEATHLQVTRVDTGEEVYLNDGSFLLRIFTAANAASLRCLVRHLASGREAYIQSGPALQVFVQACLLAQPGQRGQEGQEAGPTDPEQETGEQLRG